jgi:uncharacterized RDD family membrane protein YckC
MGSIARPTVATDPGSLSPTASNPAIPYATPAAPTPPYAVVPPYATVPVVARSYGGFWIRVVAAIIDAVLVRVVVAPLHLMFGGLGLAGAMSGVPRAPLAILGGGVTVIATVALSWLYEAFMESSSYQATVGKMIFGMRVTDLEGNRISFERATGRHFAKWLSGIILCIGYIMVGFTERKQGLHDLLAGTLVLRK